MFKIIKTWKNWNPKENKKIWKIVVMLDKIIRKKNMVFKTNEINRFDIWRTGELAGLTEDIRKTCSTGKLWEGKGNKSPHTAMRSSRRIE